MRLYDERDWLGQGRRTCIRGTKVAFLDKVFVDDRVEQEVVYRVIQMSILVIVVPGIAICQ